MTVAYIHTYARFGKDGEAIGSPPAFCTTILGKLHSSCFKKPVLRAGYILSQLDCFIVCLSAKSSTSIIVLRLPVLFLFLPDTVHPKASVFTKLRPALRAGVDNILETIQNKWYPHTAVAPAQ